MSTKFGLQENIGFKFVAIDGLTRVGKRVFSGILPSLKNAEHLQFVTYLEHIVPALSLGEVSPSFARSHVRTIYNEFSHNIQLGRNINFRYDDESGVLNYADPVTYFKRLTAPEGEDVIDKLRHSINFLPVQTHDMMVNLDKFDLLEIDYQMLEIYRHPIDNFYSWFTRGWGTRFADDPRSFTLTIEHEGALVPWYCKGFEKEWLALNPYERCVVTGISLLRRAIEQHKRAKHPDRILIIQFENLVQDTETELARVCGFLGTEPTDQTPIQMTKARCPRVLDPNDQRRKLAEFKENIDSSILDDLLAISEEYEDGVYGLRG